MTQSFVQEGKVLPLVAPYDRLTSGLGALVGGMFGVSLDTVLSGASGQFETEGVHKLTKVGSQAWTVGQRIFWDDGNRRCTSTGAAGQFIGLATAVVADGAGDTTGTVKLCPASPMLEGVQAAIADEATADGSDAATTQALANALKAKLNVLLASLRVSGLITP